MQYRETLDGDLRAIARSRVPLPPKAEGTAPRLSTRRLVELPPEDTQEGDCRCHRQMRRCAACRTRSRCCSLRTRDRGTMVRRCRSLCLRACDCGPLLRPLPEQYREEGWRSSPMCNSFVRWIPRIEQCHAQARADDHADGTQSAPARMWIDCRVDEQNSRFRGDRCRQLQPSSRILQASSRTYHRIGDSPDWNSHTARNA